MQELQGLSQLKPVKLDEELRPSEEIRLLLEPVYLGLLKPMGIVLSPIEELIPEGSYYFFPIFYDTRIYRETLDKKEFSLFLDNYESIKTFTDKILEQIEKHPGREDL